jgi:type IV secretion system protein VirB10
MPSPRTIANAVVKEPDPFLTSQVGVNIGVIENHGSPKSIGQSNHVESKSDDQVYQENENTLYQKQLAKSESKTMVATAIRDLDYKILQGKIIKGVLETAIVSDLPGMIRGHVTEDVYGEQGDVILIPNGSRLIGQYRSGRLKAGDSRVFVVWQRIIEPNGITIDINSSGSDDLGRAGLSGKVNNHFLQRFGSATLMSIISAGAATAGVHPNDQYNSEAAYRQALSQAFAQTASGELEQNIRIQPTININQGKPITILANQDVSFLQVMKEQS